MIARVRETCPPTHRVDSHRPSRADLTPVDPVAIAAWTAANERARAEYRRQPTAFYRRGRTK